MCKIAYLCIIVIAFSYNVVITEGPFPERICERKNAIRKYGRIFRVGRFWEVVGFLVYWSVTQ